VRVAKLESDVWYIRSDIGEIKGILTRLAPCIDEIYRKLPSLATSIDIANLRTEFKADIGDLRAEVKGDIANLRSELKIEIEKRPTRRQTITDVFSVVSLIGVVLAVAVRIAH
jgi:hypothetical protein